ncbi:peptidoglycan-binding protein [Phenylobacterium sp. LjRoot225]|uniref:SEL1-like repeat protein n=1 Tax=Phenylobacterium sp. LjRoot225 TaxID=3342285 RepID=UPI003ECD5951
MSAGAPWSVKGIDPKAREVAKDHARRSGMTLGEWLNRVILEDEEAGGDLSAPDSAPYAAPEPPPRAFTDAPRPRLVAETPAPASRNNDELTRVAHALDRLTDRLEASETRTGLAVSSVEHTVRQAVARIEAAERESLAVATRFEGAVELMGGEQARIGERLRRFESDAAGPRSTEALRAIEQSVGRMAGQLYEAEGRTRESVSALEARLERAETRITDPAKFMDEVVQRLGERLAAAEGHTAEALDTLRRSFAALDSRLRTVEGGGAGQDQRFEALAQALIQQVDAARVQVSERLKAVDGGRVDERFAELAADVKAAEQRSARAIQKMGHEVLTMADTLNRRLQSSEDRNAEAIAQVGGEMARVAGAMEARFGRAEQAQAQALERLSTELGRITDKLSERLLLSERRAAEAIDDVGEQVGRVTERMTQSQERTAQDLADRIRESEARTALLLEDAHSRLEQRLGEAPRPAAASAALESSVVEPSAIAPATEAAGEPAFETAQAPPAPSAAAFGPELFSRAEEAEDDELDLVDALPATPPPFAPSRLDMGRPDMGRFESDEDYAPIPEPEEDLFGLDQPEPPADGEVVRSLSTREVIEQARAAARAAAPQEKPERLQVKAKANWRSNRPAFGASLFGMRPRRGPSSTLQTAILVAGGAAFLSVGAAGVVLMQGPSDRPAEAAAIEQPEARAAVALAPQALGSITPALGEADRARPPAQLADALLTAFAKAAKGVESGEPGALAKLKAIAEAGHPPAQFYLGKLYETGDHGVKQNFAEARRWTERAAEGGDAAAMHNLALFDFRGEGGTQDLAGAARWFRAAAEQGIVDSQYNLGLLYQSGSGVPRDPAQAYIWFSVAAAGGDAQARTNAETLQGQLSAQQRAAADGVVAAFTARTGEASAQAAASQPSVSVSVVAAQRILGRLGYFQGPANGLGSTRLATAVAAYQRDQKLPVTGDLDARTAQRLAVFAR